MTAGSWDQIPEQTLETAAGPEPGDWEFSSEIFQMKKTSTSRTHDFMNIS
jgi:hypothetical protein